MVLVDTGATHNSMSQKSVDLLGLEYFPGSEVKGGLWNVAPSYWLHKPWLVVISRHGFANGLSTMKKPMYPVILGVDGWRESQLVPVPEKGILKGNHPAGLVIDTPSTNGLQDIFSGSGSTSSE
ncbi:hypothetical protein DSO57_1016691 [Entomophthora muscae]|uniref:Uncharacterized protein n=1 Tax=Entomophthora muscae TaxID=34485 RepID=A0ACC2RJB1_9FUNG|nr:hypothetical protein DSO57_1016691 [Entomophthora muscae]